MLRAATVLAAGRYLVASPPPRAPAGCPLAQPPRPWPPWGAVPQIRYTTGGIPHISPRLEPPGVRAYGYAFATGQPGRWEKRLRNRRAQRPGLRPDRRGRPARQRGRGQQPAPTCSSRDHRLRRGAAPCAERSPPPRSRVEARYTRAQLLASRNSSARRACPIRPAAARPG